MRLMRDLVGSDIQLIVDANQQWTVKQAIAMGHALAEYAPYWIEDLSALTTTPACGT